jgi:Tfp pilus assembly protein PilO
MEQNKTQVQSVSKNKFNWKFFIIISVIVLLVSAIGGVGYLYYQADRQSKLLADDNKKLDLEVQVFNAKTTELERDNQLLKARNNALDANVKALNLELTKLQNKSSSICVKDNSCRTLSPYDGFRCNSSQIYDEEGLNWCECDSDCNVVVY